MQQCDAVEWGSEEADQICCVGVGMPSAKPVDVAADEGQGGARE